MKKYKEYMDGVRASDTLHQRLLELEASGKRPVPWKKYGAVAAALVLVVGMGGFGAWAAHINGLKSPIPFYPTGYQQVEPEMADAIEPDIAPIDPGDVVEPGEKTIGGYEVISGSGENVMVSYYILPYIEYGTVEAVTGKIALDWALGEGYTEGPVSQEEIVALLGGEDVLSTHLDWDGYELFGWRYNRADGTPGLVMISGHKGELDHFEFSLMYGELPPTCIAYPDSVTQEIRGLTVTADKYDGKYGSDRRVSFMKDNWGYRFDVTAADAGQAELLVSRLVRLMADQGIGQLDWDGTYTCSICGRNFPVGSAHGHPFLGVGEPNWEDGVPDQDTSAYDPREMADPSYNAPATHTCEICGEVYPEGTAHSHEVCGLPLAPGTHTCEVCGEAVPEGLAHDCAATHICEVCGQTLPAGMEHSHQEEHHQDHHSSHH